MNIFKILAIIAIIGAALTGCQSTTVVQENTEHPCYNICVLLDGTDRLSQENSVPLISQEDILSLAERIAYQGTGSLYVSYIDENSRNNPLAVFEWWLLKPHPVAEKREHIKQVEYDMEVEAYEKAMQKYSSELESALEKFSNDIRRLVMEAYSDEVASEKTGSDVYGAVNKAHRALLCNEKAQTAHIIMFSDCQDNVGNTLQDISPATELIVVNANYEDNGLSGLASRQFVIFDQVINYLF